MSRLKSYDKVDDLCGAIYMRKQEMLSNLNIDSSDNDVMIYI